MTSTRPQAPGTNVQVYIDESPVAVAADAAEMFSRLAQQAIEAHGIFRVALSGGSTPKLLYGLLASDTLRGEVAWEAVQFFFGDERWVPHTHRDSNYKLAKDELFSKVDVDPRNIFPMPTENLTPDEAAAQYETLLKETFKPQAGEVPRFDLIFLGMGDDGHTASLFPHTAVIHEQHKLVAAHYVEKLGTPRITLTPPVLNSAAQVLFLVTGDSKASALREVLEGEYNPDEYPSQLLRNAQGQVTWHLDKAAAGMLQKQYVRKE